VVANIGDGCNIEEFEVEVVEGFLHVLLACILDFMACMFKILMAYDCVSDAYKLGLLIFSLQVVLK
jgi:hypothetical protein